MKRKEKKNREIEIHNQVREIIHCQYGEEKEAEQSKEMIFS